ncbi:hypothetical protein SAMN04488021_11152 [Paracoccus aminovorans]|uniref:Uncharacterized protein n=1 Tax=Paracoccus aminovorans TaxID=34004 RepID=A0A1I2ZYC6_9RHOB|nr:hypothetical protein [Paracoccus aminovorans]CQR84424.1 hypothetical protein JCM7685_pAMV3p0479 [Paracoccus aminovorans]SFH42479.1 hypothetical protein SAMN04488021_11152 [Paracoccus aminovorans]
MNEARIARATRRRAAALASSRNRRSRRVALALLLSLLGAVIASLWYEQRIARAILVEAETGTLHVTLTSELSGKLFQDARLCRKLPAEQVDFARRGAPMGCPARSYELAEEPFDGALPIGTRLEIFSGPRRLTLRVEEVPADYAGTETARLEGGGIVLDGEALDGFGSLYLSGLAVIGASPSQTDRIPLTAGRYQITGQTLMSVLRTGRQVLREGTLAAGAHLFFCERPSLLARGSGACAVPGDGTLASPLGTAAAEAQLQISVPDPQKPVMTVTAISRFRPVDLALHYFRTEPVMIGPRLVDPLARDPVLLLLATLGGGLTVLQLALSRLWRRPEVR